MAKNENSLKSSDTVARKYEDAVEWLKGHGFGVKKIHSNGRNQSVIIHTATGQHAEELRALFADAIASPAKE